MNMVKKLFILPIRFYKRFISPLFPACCRYYPTCSTYTLQAIEKFGVIRGTVLGAWRILRCNPWSEGGFDYVPQRFDLMYYKNNGNVIDYTVSNDYTDSNENK